MGYINVAQSGSVPVSVTSVPLDSTFALPFPNSGIAFAVTASYNPVKFVGMENIVGVGFDFVTFRTGIETNVLGVRIHNTLSITTNGGYLYVKLG